RASHLTLHLPSAGRAADPWHAAAVDERAVVAGQRADVRCRRRCAGGGFAAAARGVRAAVRSSVRDGARFTIRAVPEISRFLGIVIVINYNEHDPPHFHARYGRQKVSVRIADGLVTGSFPARALAHVLE